MNTTKETEVDTNLHLPEDVKLKLAKKYIYSLQTLTTRNRDSLDFHQIFVDDISELIDDAYRLGVLQGQGSVAWMP